MLYNHVGYNQHTVWHLSQQLLAEAEGKGHLLPSSGVCFCFCFANSSFTNGRNVSTAQFGEGIFDTTVGDFIISIERKIVIC